MYNQYPSISGVIHSPGHFSMHGDQDLVITGTTGVSNNTSPAMQSIAIGKVFYSYHERREMESAEIFMCIYGTSHLEHHLVYHLSQVQHSLQFGE